MPACRREGLTPGSCIVEENTPAAFTAAETHMPAAGSPAIRGRKILDSAAVMRAQLSAKVANSGANLKRRQPGRCRCKYCDGRGFGGALFGRASGCHFAAEWAACEPVSHAAIRPWGPIDAG